MIVNGSVSYERRVKTGEFEHKMATVVVHYAVENENETEVLAFAGGLATSQVFAMLRARPAADAPGPVPADVVRDVPVPAPVVEPAPVVADVVEPVVVVEPVATNLKQAKRAAAKKAPVVTDAVIMEEIKVLVDPSSGAVLVEEPAATTSAMEQRNVVDDFTAEAPAASDAELGQVLSRINAKLKDRPKIQSLIGEFVQAGQSYTLIPASRRGEFVQRLEALA